MNHLVEFIWENLIGRISGFAWNRNIAFGFRILILLLFTVLFLGLILFMVTTGLGFMRSGNISGGVFVLFVTFLLTVLLLAIYYQAFLVRKS